MAFDLAKHVFRPGEGEMLVTQPPTLGKIIIVVDPEVTGESKFCTLIQTLEPGGMVPVHRHQTAEQVLFFFSGRGKAVIAGHEVDVSPGTTVHVPRQTWHGFSNPGNEPLCVVETTSPPGFENAFRELSQLASAGQSTGTSGAGPLDQEAVLRIAARHDILMPNNDTE